MQFKTFDTLQCLDFQPYKICFDMQNLVYFSAPSLSACAPPLRLLWRRQCLASFYVDERNESNVLLQYSNISCLVDLRSPAWTLL